MQYQKYMYVCTFGHGLPIYMYMENAARICTLIWKIQRGTQGENGILTPAGDMYMYSYMYNIMMCFSTTNTHTHMYMHIHDHLLYARAQGNESLLPRI